MNKNKILSGGGKNLTRGGKCGWRGREVGGEGEGSGWRGGGKRGERGREVGIGYPPVHPLLNHSITIEISRKIAFGTTWVWRGIGSMNTGPNATICLVRRQNHAGTTVSWTTVQREKSSHAYKLSSNVQTACSTDSLNNCPKHSILRFSSFALKIYLWLKMCQHNLPCSIVYAHCLLPGRAFASLYILLFLEKEAEIGGRVHELLIILCCQLLW